MRHEAATASGRSTALLAALLFCASSGGLGSRGALAADSPAASSTYEQEGLLQEILVTARKREESLQRVPISAAVVEGAAVRDQNIVTLQDLTNNLPAVTLAKGSGTDRQFIRGIGSGDNASFEQSVGTFIDDIYHGRSRSSEATIFDVERVEVLKGPQTTYFGNNAIAGALNIVTRDPGDIVSGDARVSYAPKFDSYVAEGAVDVPAGSSFGVRLAGQLSGSDGWIRDVGAGDDAPRSRKGIVRGTLLWKPAESLTVRLKGQHGKEDQDGGLPIVREGCPPSSEFGAAAGFCAAAIAAGAGPLSADFTRNTNTGQFTTLRTDDAVATVSWDLGAALLTSVTGYSHYEYALGTDLDLTPLPLLEVAAPEDYSQMSQELRITSAADGALEYVAGLYYQGSRLKGRNTFSYGFLSGNIASTPAFQPLTPYTPFAAQSVFREESDACSGFGALTLTFGAAFKVTSALRYTVVDKNFRQSISVGTSDVAYGPLTPLPASLSALGAAFARAGRLATVGDNALSRKDSHTSPSLSVQYDATDDIMLYGRFDHGFKAGGFNGVDLNGSPSTLPFSEETVNAFELGVKTTLPGGRTTLNADVFHSRYRDLQLAGVVPSSAGVYMNLVQNAGGAVSRGLEVDASVRLTERLHTGLSATYLDSHYTSYPNATPTALQTKQGLPVQDLSGRETPFAPSFSGSWTLRYSRSFARDLTWRIENRLFASSGYLLNFNNDPNVRQPGYVRDDLTLALASDRGWEIAVTAQNLTDETIRTYGAALPASLGTYAFITELPRNVFAQLRYSF